MPSYWLQENVLPTMLNDKTRQVKNAQRYAPKYLHNAGQEERQGKTSHPQSLKEQ